LLGVACGSSDEPTPGTSSPPGSDAPTVSERVFDLVAGPFLARYEDDQLVVLIEAGCASIVPPQSGGDSASLNGWFHDFFDGALNEPGQRREILAVDEALDQACSGFDGDPTAFAAEVAVALDLDAADLSEFIDAACSEFAIRQQANADDPFAPEFYDRDHLTPVTDSIGLTVADLDELVDAYCS
jgi:hypothetical protein